jgi:hypothetical protein
MNCTNQNSEIPPLKARCNRMGIHVPGDNPTPAEIIPIIEQRLAAHQKHRSKHASPWTGDFAEWKNIHDAYTEFLTDLRAAQEVGRRCPQRAASANQAIEQPKPSCVQSASEKQIPITTRISPLTPASQNKILSSESGKNLQLAPPQQNEPRNEPGINPQKAGMKPEQPGIAVNQTGKCLDQIGNSGQPAPSASTQPAQNTLASPPAPEDPDAPPKIQSNDEQFIDAATDLHYQRKGRSPFDKLSPEDQAIVIDMFDKHHWQALLKVIAQPPPLGFGVKASKTALYDFRKRYYKRRRHENIQASVDLINKSSDPTHTFGQIFERLVQTKALLVASEPENSLEIFDTLITSVNKLRKQSLAERKQLHAEKSK